MSIVTNIISPGQIIKAEDLNENFADLETALSSISNSQLAGGISQDKLSDRFAVSFMHVELVPQTSGSNLATPAGFTLPTSDTTILKVVRPIVRPGWESFLCGYSIYCRSYDSAAGPDFPLVAVKLNDSVQLGGAPAELNNDDLQLIVARNAPIANPLIAVADGDYLSFSVYAPSGAPLPYGVTATLTFKHVLSG